MKVAQTSLTETEYKLLEEYARKNSKTIKEVLREAIRRMVVEDRIYVGDPLFTEPPSAKKTGRRDDASEKHDTYLYGVRA